MEPAQNTSSDEIEIDLADLLGTLLKRAWAIALSAILLGALVLGYTYAFIEPLYQSTAMFYVNNSGVDIGNTSISFSSSQISAAQDLVDTYVVILESRTTLEQVIEAAGVDYTYMELGEMISAGAVNSTQIFSITVTDPDPEEAELIANSIVFVLPERIAAIVDGSDVRIVDTAVVPSTRSSPSYIRNTVIGAVLGVILSAIVISVLHLMDDRIRTEDYLTKTYPNIPLLAVIPDMDSSSGSGYYYYSSGSGKKSSAAGKSGSKQKGA
ncbi:MAG: Wzz/FepE/Etk N-terminal domain-containing protein [Oscillospiraceae bacterium]|nr:Wzz/FepE/Etk N-terminal domain-containing protein [Oscillospiraceae bacterium]